MKIARVEALHCDGGWRPWTFVRVETDADGNAASLSASTGSGSGVIVPGTAVHLNNMLGELDLVGDEIAAVANGQRRAAARHLVGPDRLVPEQPIERRMLIRRQRPRDLDEMPEFGGDAGRRQQVEEGIVPGRQRARPHNIHR